MINERWKEEMVGSLPRVVYSLNDSGQDDCAEIWVIPLLQCQLFLSLAVYAGKFLRGVQKRLLVH